MNVRMKVRIIVTKNVDIVSTHLVRSNVNVNIHSMEMVLFVIVCIKIFPGNCLSSFTFIFFLLIVFSLLSF